ncbi:chemotaxis protein CheW [Massilia sp. PWRC2]|uniref:chemotaxis protein CheW n=1 Tax=Massilia sp. PWRC2 TaxID=2804626 RepID=UPI003CECEA5C
MVAGQTGAMAAAAERVDLVLVEIGAVLVAVPVQHVVHGLPWPQRLAPLPRRDSAACGVFEYQGQQLAMLDLARWLALGGAPRSHAYPRALIVRDAGLTVAFAVDAVRGLQKFGADAITQLSHDDNAEELFHSVARCADGDVANLLDIGRLMALARTWSADAGATAVATGASAPAAATRQRQRCALIAGRGCQIAFPVTDLMAVIDAPPLARIQSALSEGVAQWRGRHVPVTSIAKCLPALALAPVALAAPPLLAVFERDGLALGILVEQVPVIGTVAAGAAVTADDAGVSAITDDGGGLVQLVDMDALYARFPERVLSHAASIALGSPLSARLGGASTSPTNACSHIVFDAGGMASTPIDGIEAVLPLPPLAAGATHMAWRGAALALRDLRAAAGHQAPARGTVIVAQGAAAPVGFIVDAVHALVQARAGRLSRLSLPGQGVVELLSTESASGAVSYSTRDLGQLARAAN